VADTRWDLRFTAATYGPIVDPDAGPWRTLLNPGQLGAPDLAANEVWHYLRSDAVLVSIFGDKFDRLAWLPASEHRNLPRCAVYLATNFASERPTSVAIEGVSVFVSALWTLDALKPLDDGAASVATVMAHFKRVLRAPKSRTLTVYRSGVEKSLSTGENAGVVQFAGESFGPLRDLNDTPYGIAHELEARYSIHTNRDTMQIVNLS
jgi:hypothetical protein